MPSSPTTAVFAALATAARQTNPAASSFTGIVEVKATDGLPGFTSPLGMTNLPRFPASIDASDDEVPQEHKLAVLPGLHASSLEVLYVSGLLTVAQTSKEWAAVSQDTYKHSTTWLAGLTHAGLDYLAKGGLKPALPWLESHLCFIGTGCWLLLTVICL